MIIGSREFDTVNKCYIMGILNITPDSFSDGGKWDSFDLAMYRAEEMIMEGADIIDVGGESTRPGYISVSETEEIDRTAPVIEALTKRFDIPVSIDTYKSRVAKAGIDAGAVLVNDIWGLKHDEHMARTISESGAACCLMQNRKQVDYDDFIADWLDDLKKSAQIALDAKIPKEKIILDPGVGFAKTYKMHLTAVNKLDLVVKLGYPVLLGASRKSFIGKTLDLPADERMEGTLVTTVIAVMRGCSFVRVHDVKESKRAIMMTEAILQSS